MSKRVKCPDCDAEYEAGQPHQMFCEARTCEICEITFPNVIPKGAIEKNRRICERCADRLAFPDDYE